MDFDCQSDVHWGLWSLTVFVGLCGRSLSVRCASGFLVFDCQSDIPSGFVVFDCQSDVCQTLWSLTVSPMCVGFCGL